MYSMCRICPETSKQNHYMTCTSSCYNNCEWCFSDIICRKKEFNFTVFVYQVSAVFRDKMSCLMALLKFFIFDSSWEWSGLRETGLDLIELIGLCYWHKVFEVLTYPCTSFGVADRLSVTWVGVGWERGLYFHGRKPLVCVWHVLELQR